MAKKIDTSVGHLVDMISRGELRLPELQRRYVWPATRVRDLLDSLYRGYPSGTILVWETDQDVPTHDLAIEQDTGPFAPKLLLDGQQRLTSLSAVIRGEPIRLKNRVRPVEIAFNLAHPEGPPVDVIEVESDEPSPSGELETDDGGEADEGGASVQDRFRSRTFVVASNALLADSHWVKVSEIFKNGGDWPILKRVVDSPDHPQYEEYARRLQRVRAIREYPYVMHVLDRDLAYEEVAEIFVRVNSLGMKLRGSDLAMAQITARWKDSLQLFEDFAEECEKVWFTFDPGLLIRTMVAFATKQSRFRTVSSIPVPKMQESWEQAKDGIRFAVNFLRSNAGIEDESLLSSPFLVIPIAVLSVLRRKQLTQADERGLLHWLFVANAKGHYSGSSETVLDGDLGILFRGGGPDELYAALKLQVGRDRFEAADFAGRSWRNPIFPVTYLALKKRGAKDWWSGLGLSLTHQGRYHYIQYHHVFPKSVLTEAGYEGGEINEIANMAFVSGQLNRSLGNKTPNIYFPGVIEARGLDALNSQCIPTDEDLWIVQNYRRFLEWRRAELARTVNDFLDGVATEPTLGPDVGGLITSPEGQSLEFKSSARFNQAKGGVDKNLELAVAKTIAGFMNADGGSLLVGVNDAGIPTGISQDIATLARRDNDGYEQFVRKLIVTSLGPDKNAYVSVSFHELSGNTICLIDVGPGAQPCYVREGNDSRFYVRSGNITEPFTVEQAVAYVGAHW